jgi:hypothetical protein
MGGDHRGAHIPVPEQVLTCPDACLCVARRQVVAVFEQMRGEGMAAVRGSRGWGCWRASARPGVSTGGRRRGGRRPAGPGAFPSCRGTRRVGENSVLSWRTEMKRFGVRGLSQETYCVLVSAHFSGRTAASRLGMVPRPVHSAESNRPATSESRSTSVAFRPYRAPARRACGSTR